MYLKSKEEQINTRESRKDIGTKSKEEKKRRDENRSFLHTDVVVDVDRVVQLRHGGNCGMAAN